MAETRRRALAPRPVDYDEGKHGKSESGLPLFDHTLNVDNLDIQVRLILPKNDSSICWFRMMNVLDYANPSKNMYPGRKEEGGYYPIMPQVRTANYVGCEDGEKATWILYHPEAPAELKAANPYVILFKAAKKAFKAGQFSNNKEWKGAWNKLMEGGKKGGKGFGAPLSKPGYSRFAQVGILCNGDENYLEDRDMPLGFAPDDPLCIVRCSGAAGDHLFEMLDKQREDGRYVFGDPCGHYDPQTGTVGRGVFVGVFMPKKGMVPPKYTSWDGKMGDQQSYEIALASQYTAGAGRVLSADLGKAETRAIFDKFHFWFDAELDGGQIDHGALRIADYEEQALWVLKAFKPVPDLLEWCWPDNPEYLDSEDAKIVLRGRKTSVPDPDADLDGDDDNDHTPPPSNNGRRRDVTAPTGDEFGDDAPPRAAAASGGARRPRQDEDDEFGGGAAAPAQGAAPSAPEGRDEDEGDDDGDDDDDDRTGVGADEEGGAADEFGDAPPNNKTFTKADERPRNAEPDEFDDEPAPAAAAATTAKKPGGNLPPVKEPPPAEDPAPPRKKAGATPAARTTSSPSLPPKKKGTQKNVGKPTTRRRG